MDYYILARIIHILGIVAWIGGVAMVTTVVIPAAKKAKDATDGVKMMQIVEKNFAPQARITVTLTGLSGFYMLYAMDWWWRYTDIHYWWIHAMTLVWLFFTLMLFGLEPLVMHKMLEKKAKDDPKKVLTFMYRLHLTALIASVITIIGAAAGAHGWFFF